VVPTLKSIAAWRRKEGKPNGYVCVLFPSSIVIEMERPPGFVDFDKSGFPEIQPTTSLNYA
jgi:hypothetical protein